MTLSRLKLAVFFALCVATRKRTPAPVELTAPEMFATATMKGDA